ncbi:MAG: hypothetical protein CL676_13205 [Bdellovibrionaceae bacterium]|nr:hypothetical protein [Pseudobdellovibrionaceae bacterium]
MLVFWELQGLWTFKFVVPRKVCVIEMGWKLLKRIPNATPPETVLKNCSKILDNLKKNKNPFQTSNFEE